MATCSTEITNNLFLLIINSKAENRLHIFWNYLCVNSLHKWPCEIGNHTRICTFVYNGKIGASDDKRKIFMLLFMQSVPLKQVKI